MTLQARLVTEVHICGALTNTSVYATVADAVQRGFKVYLPVDCCGYRFESAHRDAVSEMTGRLGVESMPWAKVCEMWRAQADKTLEPATVMDTTKLQQVVENAIRAGEGGVVLSDPSSDSDDDDDYEYYPRGNRSAAQREERQAQIAASHAQLPKHLDEINRLLALHGGVPTQEPPAQAARTGPRVLPADRPRVRVPAQPAQVRRDAAKRTSMIHPDDTTAPIALDDPVPQETSRAVRKRGKRNKKKAAASSQASYEEVDPTPLLADAPKPAQPHKLDPAIEDGTGLPLSELKPVVPNIPTLAHRRAALGSSGLSLLDAAEPQGRRVLDLAAEDDASPALLEADSDDGSGEEGVYSSVRSGYIRASEAAGLARVVRPMPMLGRRRVPGRLRLMRRRWGDGGMGRKGGMGRVDRVMGWRKRKKQRKWRRDGRGGRRLIPVPN
ncbi:hypothetical protein BJ508DRAFT_49014 [Ascobolus immersus RN42]|uniref:Isochorismatase-like domain-containing protein n=1 Tax=Ascobolus immersus RN42 TaxID=1160509 RepID=A0A3N4HHN6_ASCIM|nr:hypothetical protein BJ508DRAFT_49014 [Ascobolus immersus RN42]